MDDTKPGEDNGEVSWYPEPHNSSTSVLSDGTVQKTVGTFRSSRCSRVGDAGTFLNNTCDACSKIPRLKSFKKRLLLRSGRTGEGREERDTTHVRTDFLSTTEMKEKLTMQRKALQDKESELFFLKSKTLRTKIRLRTVTEKLGEFAKLGSMKSICHQLQKADDEGLLNNRTVFKGILESVSRNLHVMKNGKRYRVGFKLFLEIILTWGGPRLATFVAKNLCGPEIHTIYRWRTENLVTIELGISNKTFERVAALYKELMSRHSIPMVPVLAAEDETAIVSKIMYAEDKDELLGFCGVAGTEHKCMDKFQVIVGEGEEGFHCIVNAFKDYKIGTHARAIILNPLHPDLPRVPVLIMPTFNCFDHSFVYHQWQEIERLYNQSVKPILGPSIGHSSDGDSRRRKIMLQLATCDAGDRHEPIPSDLGFVFTCGKEGRVEGMLSIFDACDQDYIHNHKKLLNPLDHASRVLRMGPYLIHMNHIRLVYDVLPFELHGLGIDDVTRRDRQNWQSAQKLSMPKVQQCLQTLMDGNETDRNPDPNLKGTQVYLKVVWYYVEIFCSQIATLRQRIRNAAIVTHFLAIWHNFVHQHEQLTLKKNFITRETYLDVLLSCHFAVLLITYMRDSFPHLECRLDLTGSDVLEDFFSKNGQWIGNHHNYSFGQMQRNVSHMIRLEEIRVDPHAPEFAKPHPKQESIWHKQYPEGFAKANLKEYPAADTVIEAWQEGIAIARELSISVGMVSQSRAVNDWLYDPFGYPGNQLADTTECQGTTDEDDICCGNDEFSGRQTAIGYELDSFVFHLFGVRYSVILFLYSFLLTYLNQLYWDYVLLLKHQCLKFSRTR